MTPRPIDPKIRARREEVSREQGRRRLRRLVIALSIAGLAGLSWYLVESPLLDVDHIDVATSPHVSRKDVLAAADIEVGDALVLVRPGVVERNVEEIPWVESASVSRRLPGRVAIEVHERRAIGWVRRAGGSPAFLVDADGFVLGYQAVVPTDLPEFRGVSRRTRPGEVITDPNLASLTVSLPPELAGRVVVVERDGDGSITLSLRDGPDLLFGKAESVRAKATAAVAVLDSLGGDRVAVIDVRVPSAPVVRRDEVPVSSTTAPSQVIPVTTTAAVP